MNQFIMHHDMGKHASLLTLTDSRSNPADRLIYVSGKNEITPTLMYTGTAGKLEARILSIYTSERSKKDW